MGGVGTPKNATRGYLHYLRAYHAGHWRAAYNLALATHGGQGTGADCRRAERFLRAFVAGRPEWGGRLKKAMQHLEAGEGKRQAQLDIAPPGVLSVQLPSGDMLDGRLQRLTSCASALGS